MALLRTLRNHGFSARRKVLLAVIVALLLAIGYAWHVGMAITRGVALRDMDWDGNGEVSRSEIMQAAYAVVVEEVREEQRHCQVFRWRGNGEMIRKDCRTEVGGAGPAAASD